MNPGIFYLYEYRSNDKLRNVGFLKLFIRYHTCEMQINMRGIPIRKGDPLKLCAFFKQDATNYGCEIGELSYGNNGLSCKIALTESDFPVGRTIGTIGGFFLRSLGGTCYAAMEPNVNFDAGAITMWDDTVTEQSDDIAEEKIPVKEDPAAEIPEEEIRERVIPALQSVQGEVPDVTPHVEDVSKNDLIENIQTEETPSAKTAAHSTSPEKVMETANLQTDFAQDTSQKSTSTDARIRKIQRSDISILPRRVWNIANNSFLLHGYHNYNHLLLVEEDGHYWLGVPGVFSPREERAAELFGFPQFTNSYIDYLELGKDEKGDPKDFGHWCRYIR